jgi:hypothetical protein
MLSAVLMVRPLHLLAADTQYTVVAVGEQGGEYVAGYASLTGGEAAPSWSDSYTHVIRGSFESVDLPDGTPIGTSGITIPASGTLATAQTFVTGGSVGEINTDTNGLRYVEIPADSHIALPQYASSQSEIYHTFYFVVKSNNANGSIRTIANGSSDTFNVDIEATTWWLYPIVYNPNPTHTLDHSNTKYLIIVFRINKSSNAIRALFTTSTESSEATSMNSSSWGTQFNIGWSSGRANNFKIYEFGVIDDYVSDTDFDAIVQSLKDKYYENLPYVADVPPSITTSTLTWTPSASNNDFSKAAIDDYSISESNVLTINSGYAVSTSPFDNVWVFAVEGLGSGTVIVESEQGPFPSEYFNTGWNTELLSVDGSQQTFYTRDLGGVTYHVWASSVLNNDYGNFGPEKSFSFKLNTNDGGSTNYVTPPAGSWGWHSASSPFPATLAMKISESINIKTYFFSDGSGYTPKTWTVHVSNDGSNWTLIDTQTNTSENGILREFPVSYNGYYSWFKFVFTASGNNQYVSLMDLRFNATMSTTQPSFSFTTTEIQTMVTTHIENGTTEGTDYHKYTNVSRQLFNGETLTNAFSSIEGSTTEAIDSASDYIVVAVGEQGGDYVVGMANLTMGSPYLDFRSNVYFLENANRLSTNTTITENSIEVVSPNWKRTTIHNALIDTSLVGKTYEFEFGLIDNITNLTDDYFAIDLVRSDATIAESLGSSGHWNDTAVTDATRNLQQLSITNDTYGLVLGGWGSRVGQTTTSHRTILPGERPYYWRLTVVASDTGGFNDVKWEMFVDPDRTPESLQYSNLFSKSDYSTANLNNFFTNNSEFYISFIGVYNSVYFRNFGTLSASTLTTNSLTWTQ